MFSTVNVYFSNNLPYEDKGLGIGKTYEVCEKCSKEIGKCLKNENSQKV